MKLLFINQTFYPDAVATAQQLTDIATILQRKGHRVTVLTGKRGYAYPHPIYPSKEFYQGIEIIRTWPVFMTRFRNKVRVLEALLVNLAFAWKLLWLGSYDKVIVLTSPPMVPFIGALFAKLRKIELIQWVMDVNPDEIIEAGWISKKNVQARVLDAALRFALRNSQQVVVLDRFMCQRIINKGIPAEQIKICPPWPHDEDLETIRHDRNPFRKKYNLQNKFIVMYSGNHSLCHPFDTLLEAANKLRNEPAIIFVFIGGGERVDEVRKYKERNKLENILQLSYQNQSEIKYSLSAANLHTIVMGDRFVGVVHPCKIYGILKIGRPFLYIGPNESHIRDLMNEDEIGFHANHGDADKVFNIIRQVQKTENKDLSLWLEKSQSIAKQKYSREFLIHRFELALFQTP